MHYHTPMWYTRSYRNAVELQRLIMQQARMEPESSDLAQMARAFCALEDTKRKLRNKPLVKPVDASVFEKRKRVEQPAFTES